MVHEFFETIANQPYLTNKCANRASHCSNPNRSFTQVFSTLFPEDGQLGKNLKSWLGVIAVGFEFNKNNENRYTRWAVEKIFRRFGFHPKRPYNIHVFNFWLYLVWVYKKLVQEDYDRDDNIFRFMRGCSIHKVKVVIMGNDPCRDIPSSGYAGSICPSTMKILDFVDKEIEVVCEHMGDFKTLSLSNKELNVVKRHCILGGWIQQGVLLLNSRLTFDGSEDIREAWKIFTDFILKYLSNRDRKIIFMFLGNVVADKVNLIDQDQHMVMKLYHPAHYTYNSPRNINRYLDWEAKLPFINANFYLWRTSGRHMQNIIGWTSIGWSKKKTRAERLRQWNDFFLKAVSQEWGLLQMGFVGYYKFGDFIVRGGPLGDGGPLRLEMSTKN